MESLFEARMKIIKIIPSKKFGGCWTAFESPGVEPCYPKPHGKERAIGYTKQRFGGTSGEVHVYDETGETVIDKIPIDGGEQYGQPEATLHF